MEYKKHLQEIIREDCYPVECLVWELSLMDSLVDRVIFLKQFIADMNAGIIKMLVDDRSSSERAPAYLIPHNKKDYDLAGIWNEHIENMYEKLKQFAQSRAPRLIREYTSIINERKNLENIQAERAAVNSLETEELVDYIGVRDMLGVSIKTAYDYRRRNLITPISLKGTRPLFRKVDILAFKHGLT